MCYFLYFFFVEKNCLHGSDSIFKICEKSENFKYVCQIKKNYSQDAIVDTSKNITLQVLQLNFKKKQFEGVWKLMFIVK